MEYECCCLYKFSISNVTKKKHLRRYDAFAKHYLDIMIHAKNHYVLYSYISKSD